MFNTTVAWLAARPRRRARRFGSGVPVAELATTLGLILPDATGSVSGWLIRQLGPQATLNATYRVDNMEFLVRRLPRGKIFEVAITRR